jgi:hypothetical protein
MKGMHLETQEVEYVVSDDGLSVVKVSELKKKKKEEVETVKEDIDDSTGEDPTSASSSTSKSKANIIPKISDLYNTDPAAVGIVIYILRRLNCPMQVIEPCCGSGAISDVLVAEGFNVIATDKFNYGKPVDFLADTFQVSTGDIIISKFPFMNTKVFVEKAVSLEVPCMLLLPVDTTMQSYFHDLAAFNAMITVTPFVTFSRNGDIIEDNHPHSAWFLFNFPNGGNGLDGILHFNSKLSTFGKKGNNTSIKPEGIKIPYGVDMNGYVQCPVCSKCVLCSDATCAVCLTCANCDGAGVVCE